ncbi:hypothetical protein [Lentzea sp. NPDC004782]|uniref:hypothetical protein n=1 Tax=Lentzea sp. NPDC004782 TaxID=3154458 RepID=UPI0033A3812F
MSISRALMTALAVSGVAIAGVVVAQANEPTPTDQQLPLVEDFGYPDAARILAEDKVELLSGDGHILYVPCAAQPPNGIGQIEVHSADLTVGKNKDGVACFTVVGTYGQITLKMPKVYEIRGDGFGATPGHKGTAEIADQAGERHTVTLNPNGAKQVGISVPGGKPETLLRLDIKP